MRRWRNGVGKSTTIKMLTGLLAPPQVASAVLGMDPVSERLELARRIGVVFGQRTQLWRDLPLEASFDLLRRVYQVERRRHAHKLEMFVEMLELRPFRARHGRLRTVIVDRSRRVRASR